MAGTYNQPNNYVIVSNVDIGDIWNNETISKFTIDPSIGSQWTELFLSVKGLSFNSTDLDGLHGFFALLEVEVNGTFGNFCVAGSSAADIETQGPIRIPFPSLASSSGKLAYRCRLVGTPGNLATGSPVVVPPSKFSCLFELTFAS